MKETQELKNRLGLGGEYRVLSELLLKGYNASITMGNSKGTDLVILGENKKYIRVEVKTSKNGRNFVTSYFPKYATDSHTDPDIWVLFLPKEINKIDEDIFYILKHNEVRELQLIMNKGKETKKGEGVDNISLKLLENEKTEPNKWNVINECLNE